MLPNITLYDASVWVLPVLIAITFHEAAHAFVAYRLGDNTAWQLGRVSFNPFKHIDPFGTVILPGVLFLSHSPFLFGYAKPVPVNFRNLNNPRLDMVWVALAGPRPTSSWPCWRGSHSIPCPLCPPVRRNGPLTTSKTRS